MKILSCVIIFAYITVMIMAANANVNIIEKGVVLFLMSAPLYRYIKKDERGDNKCN